MTPCALQEGSGLFGTIEDFMWFKVAMVRAPRSEAGPSGGHGPSLLSQG